MGKFAPILIEMQIGTQKKQWILVRCVGGNRDRFANILAVPDGGKESIMQNTDRMKRVLKRAAELSRQRENRKIAAFTVATTIFSVLLIYCITAFPEQYQSGTVTESYGSILLIDGVGGYVLTAVVTFIAATIITVICIKKQK